MAQITIYLEDDLANAMRNAAKAQNTSQSKWIASLIEKAIHTQWSDDVIALAGAWKQFPTLEEIRQNIGTDTERESF